MNFESDSKAYIDEWNVLHSFLLKTLHSTRKVLFKSEFNRINHFMTFKSLKLCNTVFVCNGLKCFERREKITAKIPTLNERVYTTIYIHQIHNYQNTIHFITQNHNKTT